MIKPVRAILLEPGCARLPVISAVHRAVWLTVFSAVYSVVFFSVTIEQEVNSANIY